MPMSQSRNTALQIAVKKATRTKNHSTRKAVNIYTDVAGYYHFGSVMKLKCHYKQDDKVVQNQNSGKDALAIGQYQSFVRK